MIKMTVKLVTIILLIISLKSLLVVSQLCRADATKSYVYNKDIKTDAQIVSKERSFKDRVWFISNDRKNSMKWKTFHNKIDFKSIVGSESVANSSQSRVDKREIKSSDRLTTNSKMKRKPKRNNKNTTKGNYYCLIFRLDLVIGFNYLDTENRSREARIRFPKKPEVWDNHRVCLTKYNEMWFGFNGIGVRLMVQPVGKNKSLNVFDIQLKFDEEVMRNSTLPQLKHFQRLIDRRYRPVWGVAFNPCFQVITFPKTHALWCPLKQVFEYMAERQAFEYTAERQVSVFVEIEDLFVEAFRESPSRVPMRPLFDCTQELSHKIVTKVLLEKRSLLLWPNNTSKNDILWYVFIVISCLLFISMFIVVYFFDKCYDKYFDKTITV